MGILHDKDIRKHLIQKLERQPVRPKAIIEELRVHNGNAIADVVAIYREAHCYEIKGDGDKIERILEQGQFYNLAFSKISIVTTQRHLDKAISLAPHYWGIILTTNRDEEIIFKYIRKAKSNKYFNKKIALLTLWKSEMLYLIQNDIKKNQRLTRDDLTTRISEEKSKKEISEDISISLLSRYRSIIFQG